MYLYHRVVDNFQGNILYPLNELKNIYPEQYELHKLKYKDRENVLDSKIPDPLNCLWNDVLHFTAVNPVDLFNAMKDVGFDVENLVWRNWYKIPIEKFDLDELIVCVYDRDIENVQESRTYYKFEAQLFDNYKNIKSETIEYYKEKFIKKEKPLFFHRMPHFLYKGTLDIYGLEIVKL